MFEQITANFDRRSIRYESLEGKPHTVIPMVMLVPGVHSGTNGPILYTENELRKAPHSWNLKPVVVTHPMRGGRVVAACDDPAILSKYKVGVILNTHWDADAKKLRAEAWLENDRTPDALMDGIHRGTTMEISTGVFTDNEATPGEFRMERYDAVARNLRPDHLALLPNEVGACSVADGCGLQANSAPEAGTVAGLPIPDWGPNTNVPVTRPGSHVPVVPAVAPVANAAGPIKFVESIADAERRRMQQMAVPGLPDPWQGVNTPQVNAAEPGDGLPVPNWDVPRQTANAQQNPEPEPCCPDNGTTPGLPLPDWNV